MLRGLPLFLALMFFAALLEAGAGEEGPGGRWTTGAQVRVECRDWHTGDWGHGPLCKETGKELEFSFGIDNFLYCGLEIADESAFRDMVQIVKLESAPPPDPTTLGRPCIRSPLASRAKHGEGWAAWGGPSWVASCEREPPASV